MATPIYVLCRSHAPITYGELEDVMGHFGWLDKPAKFDPPIDETNSEDPSWRSFEVEYDPKQRPVVVNHFATAEEMAPSLADVRDLLEGAEDTPIVRELLARIDVTKQIVVFEIPGDPPQDVWEMCDAAEAFLARERDGIIVAGEGVFDGEMNQLLALD